MTQARCVGTTASQNFMIFAVIAGYFEITSGKILNRVIRACFTFCTDGNYNLLIKESKIGNRSMVFIRKNQNQKHRLSHCNKYISLWSRDYGASLSICRSFVSYFILESRLIIYSLYVDHRRLATNAHMFCGSILSYPFEFQMANPLIEKT